MVEARKNSRRGREGFSCWTTQPSKLTNVTQVVSRKGNQLPRVSLKALPQGAILYFLGKIIKGKAILQRWVREENESPTGFQGECQTISGPTELMHDCPSVRPLDLKTFHENLYKTFPGDTTKQGTATDAVLHVLPGKSWVTLAKLILIVPSL